MMHTGCFLETIRIENGMICHAVDHENRMRESVWHFFGQSITWNLQSVVIPQELRRGIVKCRVLYDREIRKIEFTPYVFRRINSLQIVDGKGIYYPFKSTDRHFLDDLAKQKGLCDEVLIVQDRKITDTSFSNVVFSSCGKFYTPSTFLLNGTCRQRLLREGVIEEREIKLSDLPNYDRVYLINAMIRLEDQVALPVEHIFF